MNLVLAAKCKLTVMAVEIVAWLMYNSLRIAVLVLRAPVYFSRLECAAGSPVWSTPVKMQDTTVDVAIVRLALANVDLL